MKKSFPVLVTILAIGNLAVAQWESTEGPKSPKGVQINTIAVKGDIIFAGAYRGGIYLSEDGGASWSDVNAGLPWKFGNFTSVNCLSIIEDTVIAGTASGIYLSVNCGETWSEGNEGLPDLPNIRSLTYANGYLFAGTEYGVYRSGNHGVGWEAARLGLPRNTYGYYLPIESLTVQGGFLFAGTYDGVHRSSDNGMSWVPVNNGIEPNRDSWHPRIAAFTGNDSILYAGAVSGNGVHWSTDHGESWSTGNTGLPTYPVGTPMSIWSLAATGGVVFAGTEVGVSCSEDGGKTWTDCNSRLPEFPFVSALTVRGNELLAGTFRGIYRLNSEELNWEEVFRSHPTTFMVKALGKSGSSLFASGYGAYPSEDSIFVFRSTDLGDTWLGIDSVMTRRFISTFVETGGTIYGGGSGVFFSEDHGETWISIGDGLHHFVNALLVRENRLFVGTGEYALQTVFGGVYVSDDRGTTWEIAGLTSKYVTSLVEMGDKIFAGTRTFGWGESGGIYMTSDDGVSWSSAHEGIPSGANVYALMAHDGDILTGTSAGIFISSDYGDSWNPSDFGMPPNVVVNSFVINRSGILAATSKGVFISHDNGTSWNSNNTGLPGNALRVQSLEILGDYVFVGTSDGVWRAKLLALVLAEDNQVPISFQLGQNHPNPFNPVTTIRYELPRSSHVRLSVFDILGREMAVLGDREEGPGIREVQWNASNVPSGIYFIQMLTGDYRKVRKMMVLK